ncbi:MAG: amidase [Balneola sp.]
MKNILLFLVLTTLCFTSCTTSSKFDELGLEEITISELHQGYENGDYTITDVVEAYIQRIEDVDINGPAINSIIEINPDAIEIARQLDKELAAGNKRGPLHGIPVILKDNIDTHDKMSTTAGARAMAGSKPLKDAFIVEKLRESGAIILAKANLSEWANFHSSFSSSGWSGLGGQTKNPYDITRNPCGSSAGSGASASANLAVFAIGTETNGSITCPSSANGLVGVKPTVGLLSRSGIIPISFTQDTPGPMTRTVTDAAIALGTMVGVDETDSKTSASEGNYHTDYTQFLNEGAFEGKRIGVFNGPRGRHFRVDSMFNEQLRLLESNGATLVEIDQIGGQGAGGDSFQVLLYEFKDGLNAYFASLGPDAKVKDMNDLIEKTLNDPVEIKYFDHDLLLQANEKEGLDSEDYQTRLADLMRKTRDEGIDAVMQEHNLDAFVSITGGPAWKTDHTNGDNFGLSSSSPAARAGYPNITLPMGYVDGLPVGINFFGTAWTEPLLIELAYSYEQLNPARKAPEFKNYEF